MKKSSLIITIIIFGVIIAGYSYSNKGVNILFDAIAQSGPEPILELREQNQPFYPHSEPAIMVVPSSAIEQIIPFIPLEQQQALSESVTTNQLIVAVFQGVLSYTPHGIQIQDMKYRDGSLFVHVFIHGYEKMVAMGVGSSDFEIVTFDRSALPELNAPLNVYMLDQNGDTIASTTLVLE